MKLVLNHKMNLNKEEIKIYKEELEAISFNDEVIVCPSNLYLDYYSNSKYDIGAQDVSINNNGAYTGEVSVEQIKSVGTKYCIVGHSERRKYHLESSELLNKKLIQLLNNGIIPILCIGETLEEKQQGITDEVLLSQVQQATKKLTNKEKIIIAYEPIWAIGTGMTPTKEEIENTIQVLKSKLDTEHQFLYGGSVNQSNAKEFMTISNIVGFLIGGLGLKVEEMKKTFL